MNTGGPFSYEVVREAAQFVENGTNKQTAITQFKVRWGLTTENAERLYKAARKESVGHLREEGTSDLIWGFVSFAVGGGITAVTYATSAPGGTYFLFWGPMIFGAYRLFKGFNLKFRSSVDKRGVFMWLAAAIALGAGLVAAATLTINVGEVEEPADSEFVWLEDEPVFPSDDRMRLAGQITNMNDEWTITSPYLVVELFDENDVFISSQTVELAVDVIAPGGSRSYMANIDLVDSVDGYQTTMEWEWVIE